MTVVLVHGGFLGPWSCHDVAADLENRGIETVIVGLPSVGDPVDGPLGDFYADAREVRRVLDSLPHPVLLCGHSYGGAVITEGAAGPHPVVAHLVYLAGAVLDVNESMASFGPNPDHAASSTPDQENTTPEGPAPGPAGTIALPPDQAITGLFHDCSADRARRGADQLRPMNPAVGAQPLTGVAWRDLPSTYVRCARDRLPEIVTKAFFECNPQVMELPTGHCPNWSRPDLVAELLATRAEQLDSSC